VRYGAFMQPCLMQLKRLEMQEMEFTPEPFSALLVAIAGLVAALGIPAFKRGMAAANASSPEDRMQSALAANTAAVNAQIEQFRHNNGLFVAMGGKLDITNSLLRDQGHISTNIHSELIRISAKGGINNG
jgi:hypothetical protein